jgi:hypothetical protein
METCGRAFVFFPIFILQLSICNLQFLSNQNLEPTLVVG